MKFVRDVDAAILKAWRTGQGQLTVRLRSSPRSTSRGLMSKFSGDR
jgi:hypothetical protein